jgi:hypothetical protein
MAKTDDLVRVQIRQELPPRERVGLGKYSYMNIYVDTAFNVKVGDKITLKDSDDPKAFWEIINIYETVQRTSINRGWNNNI